MVTCHRVPFVRAFCLAGSGGGARLSGLRHLANCPLSHEQRSPFRPLLLSPRNRVETPAGLGLITLDGLRPTGNQTTEPQCFQPGNAGCNCV